MNTSTCRSFAMAVLLLMTTSYGAFAQVKAHFSATVTQACSPLVVRFTDQSTGNPTSWKWDFGNGNLSTQQNPGAVYLQAGFKTIRLIVSDGVTSDTLVMPNYIEVYQNPVADFSQTAISGCTPFRSCFTDSSTAGSGAITKYFWDFGDGQYDSTKNACATYATPGNYSVSLFVTDTNGCTSQKVKSGLVTTAAKPISSFTSANNSSCSAPLNVVFQNTTQGTAPISSIWNFGDNSSSAVTTPSHNYATPGTYTVSLISSNSLGCKDTLIKTNFVAIEQLIARFNAPTTGCIASPMQFTDSSTSNPSTYRWSFGDGDTSSQKNPIHTYMAAGTYTVKMFASNSSCADSVTKTSYITIAPSPTAGFTSVTRGGCILPYIASFTDSSTNAIAWSWNFGDSTQSTQKNPSHTYTAAGTYSVSLTVTSANGCTNTIVKTAFITVVGPKAIFSADTSKGCLPLTTKFTSTSTSVEPIVSYFWDFGDGTTSTLASPSHTYTRDSIFTVKLIVINASGCTDTLIRPAYIKAGNKPTAGFTATPLQTCLYTPATFTYTGSTSDQWSWAFGDNSNSIAQNPAHAFADTGLFTIRLIAYHNGCPDTIVRSNYIHIAPPRAAFDMVYDCANPLTVKFTDHSMAPTGYYWSFGDSTNSTLPSPTHTYAVKGSYTATLMVTDSFSGCIDIAAKQLKITQPKADFYSSNQVSCRTFVAALKDTSVDATSYKWTSSINTSSVKNPSFTYTTPGLYDVKLVITDINGCKDSITKPDFFTVKGPTANFSGTPLTGCAPLVVNFSDSSKAFMANIVSWKWKFGDGDSSSLQNPSHLYKVTGSYTVSLIVTDASGCSHAVSYSNLVRPTFPKPAFVAPQLTCTGKNISFTNSSVVTNGTYLWNFGDGDTSHLVSPTHHYNNEGTYTISLKVTDANGCDSTLTKIDYVSVANPRAGFAADSIFASCPPLVVNFRDTSIGAPTGWKWNFGDGTTSVLKNPSHVYTTPGHFKVTLTITTALGCTDSVMRTDFVVVNGPEATFTFTPHNTCESSVVSYFAVTTHTATRTWDFGDGDVINGSDTTTHIYDSTGVYHPVLIIDDGLGCVRPIPSTDSIVIGYLHAAFTHSNSYFCKQGTITFTDKTTTASATPITSWLWNFGDGTTSTLQNPSHLYTTPGLYTVTLRVTNATCIDSIAKVGLINIDKGPQVSFTSQAYQHCIPYNAQFTSTTVSDSTLTSLVWNFGNGHMDSIANPTQYYDTAGTYHVSLVATSVTGCSGRADTTITIYALPVITKSPGGSICYSDTIILHASGGTSYAWSPAAGLSDSSSANPHASPTATTQYGIVVTDAHGCQSSDSLMIKVNPLPEATINPDRVMCATSTVELWAMGGDKYQWTPSASLTCDTCGHTVASPAVNTTYIVKVSTNAGCYVYDTTHVTVNPMPQGLAQHSVSICKNDSVALLSTGGTTTTWLPATGLSCRTCGSPNASPDSTTTYELTIYNQFQCGFKDTVLVTVNPLPTLAITAVDSVCQGASTNIVATGGTSYSWAPSVTLSCATCATPTATPASTTVYELTGKNSFGCISHDSVAIRVNPVPQLHTIADAKVCVGDNIRLTSTATDADNISWSPTNGLDDSTSLSPLVLPGGTTTYVLSGSNRYGCTNSTAVTISSINKVHTAISNDTSICFGQSVQLHSQILEEGSKGTVVIWTPINGLESTTVMNPISKPTFTQLYTMMAFSGSCVPDTQHVTVTVNSIPNVTIAQVRKVVENTAVTLEASSDSAIVKYEWTPAEGLSCNNCANPTLTAAETKTYTVNVVDHNGCASVASVNVDVVGNCADQIFVPNYFTPNGDDVNDQLFVRGLGLTGLKVFRIFDRWGAMVFESKDINQGWNGVYKGTALSPGVFVYYIESTCTNGETAIKQGNVTLMR